MLEKYTCHLKDKKQFSMPVDYIFAADGDGDDEKEEMEEAEGNYIVYIYIGIHESQ